jgi:hypothetical protein
MFLALFFLLFPYQRDNVGSAGVGQGDLFHFFARLYPQDKDG